ncbi:MAG: hypothetical protein AAF604_07455 [Acidobacteriota bacterium]
MRKAPQSKTSFVRYSLVALLLVSTATTLDATEPSPQGSGDYREPRFSLGLDLTSIAELEFSDSLATAELNAASVDLGLPWFELSAGIFDFTWEGAEDLAFANGAAIPWEQLSFVELRKTITRPLNQRLFFTTSLGAGMSYEEESDDSLYADAFAAVIWRKSADWSFLFGAGYSWHTAIDVEYEVIPALGFSYREGTERGFSASLGIPKTEMRYRFNPRSAVALGGDFQSFVTRLADDSEVAPAGYAEFIRFGAGLLYEYRVPDRFKLELGPTFGLGGELKIHDRDGLLLSSEDLEPTPGFALKAKLSF